jgi:hypothetical protein
LQPALGTIPVESIKEFDGSGEDPRASPQSGTSAERSTRRLLKQEAGVVATKKAALTLKTELLLWTRVFDNILTERFRRALNYEEIYIKDYEDAPTPVTGAGNYLDFYNGERLHLFIFKCRNELARNVGNHQSSFTFSCPTPSCRTFL